MTREQRTARMTVLIDPGKKAVFESLCVREDVTPSQVVRRLIRDYIERRSGRPWKPGDRVEDFLSEPTPEVAATSESTDVVQER